MDEVKNNVAAQTVVEPDTTQTSSPQVKEETTKPQTTEGEAVQQEVTADVEASMTPEARRAFQDQRLKIKQLEEETAARQTNESAFSAFRPQPQVPPQVSQFTDQYTGETNWAAFNQAQSNQIQAQAAQAAEDRIDEYKAREKFPDLFADREVEQTIADQWFASKMRGENLSVSQIAESVSKRFGKVVSKAEKSGAEKALEQVTPKEQAALSASSQTGGSRQLSSDENQSLVDATRRGSDDAIAARMRGIPWANK